MRSKSAPLTALAGIAVLLVLAFLWSTQQQDRLQSGQAGIIASVPAEPELAVRRSGSKAILNGMVSTKAEEVALVVAAGDAGFAVENELQVSSDLGDVGPREAARVLGPLLSGAPDSRMVLRDRTLIVTGEALDPVEAEHIAAALEDARRSANESGLTIEADISVRQLAESVQITALQAEIEQIFELARQVEGKSPNFEEDGGELSRGAMDTLDRVVVAMRRYPLPSADIIGHTDSEGAAADNQVLSEERARTVLDYLVESGVGPERLSAFGRGEEEPLSTNATEAGKADNRRVEFIIKKRNS